MLETIKYLYTPNKKVYGELKYTPTIFSDYKKHFHTHLGLTLIEEGFLQITYDKDSQVTLDKHSIAVFNPKQIHQSKVIDAQGYYVLFLHNQWCQEIQKDFFFSHNIIKNSLRHCTLKEIFSDILIGNKVDIENKLKILMRELFSQYTSSVIKIEKDMIKKTKIYIENHCDESLSVEEVALHVGYDKSYLIRKFKNEVGITPQRYILNEKVNRAKDLLSYGETKSLSSISMHAGFFDQSHFNRNFKNHFGISPKKYKKVNIVQDKDDFIRYD
jgi:AraC-like DNA-binding protein